MKSRHNNTQASKVFFEEKVEEKINIKEGNEQPQQKVSFRLVFLNKV